MKVMEAGLDKTKAMMELSLEPMKPVLGGGS
jgi:hypothetical protein